MTTIKDLEKRVLALEETVGTLAKNKLVEEPKKLVIPEESIWFQPDGFVDLSGHKGPIAGPSTRRRNTYQLLDDYPDFYEVFEPYGLFTERGVSLDELPENHMYFDFWSPGAGSKGTIELYYENGGNVPHGLIKLQWADRTDERIPRDPDIGLSPIVSYGRRGKIEWEVQEEWKDYELLGGSDNMFPNTRYLLVLAGSKRIGKGAFLRAY